MVIQVVFHVHKSLRQQTRFSCFFEKHSTRSFLHQTVKYQPNAFTDYLWTEHFLYPYVLKIRRKMYKQCMHKSSRVFTDCTMYLLYSNAHCWWIHIKQLGWKQLLLAHCINCRIRWRNWTG